MTLPSFPESLLAPKPLRKKSIRNSYSYVRPRFMEPRVPIDPEAYYRCLGVIKDFPDEARQKSVQSRYLHQSPSVHATEWSSRSPQFYERDEYTNHVRFERRIGIHRRASNEILQVTTPSHVRKGKQMGRPSTALSRKPCRPKSLTHTFRTLVRTPEKRGSSVPRSITMSQGLEKCSQIPTCITTRGQDSQRHSYVGDWVKNGVPIPGYEWCCRSSKARLKNAGDNKKSA